MGQTITFNQASYVIDPPSKPTSNPPTGLVVTDTVVKAGGSNFSGYLLQNYGDTTITDLRLEGENSVNSGPGAATGLNISVRSPNDATTPTATSSIFNFGSALKNDTLVIGSSANNTVNMGDGIDSLQVVYSSTGDEFNLGMGSDKVVFGGNITNTKLDLGSDSVIDKVGLAAGASISGLIITGANSSDILYIGTTKYIYQASTATGSIWQNSTNPSDTKNFS